MKSSLALVCLFCWALPLSAGEFEFWTSDAQMIKDCEHALSFTAKYAKRLVTDSDEWNYKYKSWKYKTPSGKGRAFLETFVPHMVMHVQGGGLLAQIPGNEPALVTTTRDVGALHHHWENVPSGLRIADSDGSLRSQWREQSSILQNQSLIPALTEDVRGRRWLVYAEPYTSKGQRLTAVSLANKQTKVHVNLNAKIIDFKIIPQTESIVVALREPSGKVVIRVYDVASSEHKFVEVRPADMPEDGDFRKLFVIGKSVAFIDEVHFSYGISEVSEAWLFESKSDKVMISRKDLSPPADLSAKSRLSFGSHRVFWFEEDKLASEPGFDFQNAGMTLTSTETVTDILDHPSKKDLFLVATSRNDSSRHFSLKTLHGGEVTFKGKENEQPNFAATADVHGWFVSVWRNDAFEVFRVDENGIRLVTKSLSMPFRINFASTSASGRYLFFLGQTQSELRVLVAGLGSSGDSGGNDSPDIFPVPPDSHFRVAGPSPIHATSGLAPGLIIGF